MAFERLLADNDVPRQKKRIIRVVNTLSIATAITVFILGPYLYWITGYKSILYPALVEGSLFMIVPLLNNYGKHIAALHLMFIIHAAAVGYYTLILGPESNNLAFSVFLCVSAVTIFSNHKARAGAIVLIMAIALFVDTSHSKNLIPILELNENALINLDKTVKISVIVLTITILYSHDLEARLNEKEKESMRSNLDWLNKKLDQLNQSLDNSNKSKSVYVRTTTHELRTPLNIIFGLAQIYELKKDYQKQSVNFSLPDFDTLFNQSTQLMQIVNNTQVWARIEAGEKEEINVTSFHIREWMRTEVLDHKRLAPSGKTVRLYADAGNLPPVIMVDVFKLKRVLTNLLSNALKFTRDDTTVLISGYVENETLIFTVEDKGPGIPIQMIEKIFTPFYTGSNQNTESTGVGLPIALEMTRLLGGKIAVQSDGSTGSTFIVELPLIQPEIEEAEKPEPEKPSDKIRGRKVLVIDDDELALMVAKLFLEHYDAQPILLQDSLEAINTIVECEPEVILLDLHMPYLSGREVLQEILNHPKCSHIPVVIMSGDAFKEQEIELLDLGATEYVRKPMHRIELAEKLTNIFNTAKLVSA